MRTCLVVDDSSVIRKVARRILEGLDFQIIEAEDGEKALEICKRGLPEAILLDWNMPVMDGYEFLGNLRRMPGGDQPKVVFCTTDNDVAHLARAWCRRQRIHHEALRQGHRRGEIPGSRVVYAAGVVGPAIRSCLYQLASGRDMSAEPIAGATPRDDHIRSGGHPCSPMSRRPSAQLASRTGIRVTVPSLVDIHQKSFRTVSRGRQ